MEQLVSSRQAQQSLLRAVFEPSMLLLLYYSYAATMVLQNLNFSVLLARGPTLTNQKIDAIYRP
jgi:hypothetical protein